MANVTQLIPNYLGGVSRRADFDKDPGQVRDAVNAYPDDTYGMLKRPGVESLGKLPIPEGTDTNWSDWSFFPLIREGRPRYLIGMQSGDMIIWNMDDPTKTVTINFEDNAKGYLSYHADSGVDRKDMFRIASDDRRTIIVNRSKTVVPVEVGPEGSGGNPNNPDPNDKYRYSGSLGFIWANEEDGKYRSANTIGQLPDSSAKEVNLVNSGDGETSIPLRPGWHILGTSHGDTNDGYGLTVKIYLRENEDGTKYIDSAEGVTIVSPGYGYYTRQQVSVNGVNGSVVEVVTGLQVGHVYRVKQTAASDDDYYMMPFSNTDDAKGPFFWVEGPAPNAGFGLSTYTLPFSLVEDKENEFTIKLTDYSNRWAGDNTNNADPSFVGHRIEGVFFSNNRLGFLSQDNVILSRPINYGPPGSTEADYVPDDNPYVRRNYTEIDFYHQSALQQVADDPIDLNAASNDTSVFHEAIATPQGLVLFSDGQQSLMFSEDGILTAANANIRGISAYDVAPDISPLMIGNQFYFANKTDKYCRLYAMQTQGLENPPEFLDISKEVSDWLPNNMTDLIGSRTTNQIILFNRSSNYLYILTMLGELFSWTKWELPTKPLKVVFDHTRIYSLMQDGVDLYLGLSEMFLYPNSEQVGDVSLDDPYLDLYCKPTSVTDRVITPPDSFPKLSSQPCYLVTDGERKGEVGDLTYDDTTLVADRSIEAVKDLLIIGYRYTFSLELPTFFYQQSEEGLPDYTAYLTISRLKFALSLSGDADFKSKARGEDTWTSTYQQTLADYYIANTPLLAGERVAAVPIHQRNTNFGIQITSETPYPLSVDSCMWEGIYSPRYYRRS